MPKAHSFSEQLRRRIKESGVSQYRLCLECDINKSTMSRFMAGKGGLSIRSIDALTLYLDLELKPRQAVAKRKRG